MTTTPSLKGADFLSLSTLDAAQISELFITAAATKRDISPYRRALDGKTIILLFEKPSLRTRVTFEVGPGKMSAKTFFGHSRQSATRIRPRLREKSRAVGGCDRGGVLPEVLEELAENLPRAGDQLVRQLSPLSGPRGLLHLAETRRQVWDQGRPRRAEGL
jgi:ornithine carbamoyltransferase